MCSPLQPIGDAAGLGEVETGKCRKLWRSPVAGRGGKVTDFPISFNH
jgi:hypothetical protein